MIQSDSQSVLTSVEPELSVLIEKPGTVIQLDSLSPPDIMQVESDSHEVIEVEAEWMVVLAERDHILLSMGEVGPRGPPGAGGARYVKHLSGLYVSIPTAEHQLTDVVTVIVRDSSGNEVGVAVTVTPSAVVIESNVPMTAHIAILE